MASWITHSNRMGNKKGGRKIETEKEIKELEDRLKETEFKPIESPIKFSLHNWEIRRKERELALLNLDIAIARAKKLLNQAGGNLNGKRE